MKVRTGLLLFLILICSSNVLSLAQATSAQPGSPEAVIRSFYKWYVHSLNQNSEPLEKQPEVLRKYVTERLIQELNKVINGPDGLDADYFLDAQDWDKDWEKNIGVSSVVVGKTIATARVTLSGSLMPKHRLSVTLKQERGVWKIDKVKGLNN